jgi:oligopeptidase B
MKIPKAEKRPQRPLSLRHVADDWKYLEDLRDPETKAYLKAENTYYRAMMRPLGDLKKALFQELKERTAEDDSSIPERDGEYWYYVRYEKGQQYPLFCRKHLSLDAPEEVYFDHNAIAATHSYCDVGYVDVSPNHRIMAYAIDLEGNERYTLRFRDLTTKQELSACIEGVSGCFEWKTDQSFFYVKLDENDRPLQLYFRDLSQSESVLVYEEKDASFFLGLDSSESDEYIFLGASGYDANEIWFHPIRDPGHEFRCFMPRRDGHEYELSHHNESFLIVSNDNAVNFQIFKTSVYEPEREHWALVQGHNPDIYIEGLTVFRDFWVISERHRALPRLKIMPLTGGVKPYWIQMQEEAYELTPSEGRDYRAESFRYWYSTPRVPQTLYEHHVVSKAQTLLKRRLTGSKPFHEEEYVVKRLWAKARDGVSVPVTLLYHMDTQPGADLILHSYGSYGEMLDCEFSNYKIVLVERGFIYAMAHVRGGTELGKSWYLDGKLTHKKNTFNDYIDVAEFLIQSGLATQGRIIGEGSSAGGMLMGVVANERPDLFLGIVASVPFVDVLNTMLDPSLPLTTLEYKEWGNPSNSPDYEYIKSYSPYENVKAQAYPHMLVVASLHDQRVLYWEAAKWVAKLRATKTSDSLLLLKIDDDSGHAGASGRYDSLKELAEELAFMVMLKSKT